MADLGRMLIIFGIIIICLGIFFTVSHKISFIGKLPGDLLIKKGHFTFYFPIATSIIVSIILSLITRFFNR